MKQLSSNQKGQALAIVLALMAIGGLTIAVNLNYATTSLKGTEVSVQDMSGDYAAAAGVEQTLWYLNNGITPIPTQTPENINQMAVSINTTVGTDIFTLYLDDLQTGVHSSSYHVSSNITSVGGNIYNYLITVTTDAGAKPNASVTEFGSLLPFGYTYVAGSAASYHATNLSSNQSGSGGSAVPNPQYDNPTSTGYDSMGNQWLKWDWSNQGPRITNSAVYIQRYQITGTGSTWGSYSWIMGGSNDIGTVGQITGSLTTIISTARRQQDGKITAIIKVDVIKGGGGLYVFSWKITK